MSIPNGRQGEVSWGVQAGFIRALSVRGFPSPPALAVSTLDPLTWMSSTYTASPEYLHVAADAGQVPQPGAPARRPQPGAIIQAP